MTPGDINHLQSEVPPELPLEWNISDDEELRAANERHAALNRYHLATDRFVLVPPAEPIDLVAEGKAIAALLETLSKLSDRSKGRVLGAVVDLSQTSGPFVPGYFKDPPSDWMAENFRKLNEIHGAVREEGDDSP